MHRGSARPALRRSLSSRRDRARLVVVVLVGAGAALSMGMVSPASDPAARPTDAVGLWAQDDPAARAGEDARRPHRGDAEDYARTLRKRVRLEDAVAFLPLHREAGRRYGVNWRLLASVHRQETAFSTASTTYHGLNAYGCCAGPMQFNVTNGPVSTWQRYRNAFRAGGRPKSYPHRTRNHPSIYDDFDAIMAAAMLLRDSGAGPSLDAGAWRAAYAYYGHDQYGVTYANEVLARAVGWQRHGFCPNCAVDTGLVDLYEILYGKAARRALGGEEPAKAKKKRKAARDKPAKPKRERKARKPSRRQPTPKPKRAAPPAQAAPQPAPALPAATTTTQAPPAAAPPPPPCSVLNKLLNRC